MRKMAIISSTNYQDWPMGGMLSFLRDIIPYLAGNFHIELWGVKTANEGEEILLGGREFKIFFFSQLNLKRKKFIPNIARVVKDIKRHKEEILSRNYHVLYFHGIPLELPFLKVQEPRIVTHVHWITNPFSVSGNPFTTLLQFPYEILRGKIVNHSHLVFLSADTPSYEKFKRKFRKSPRIVKIHNFADPKVFHPKEKNALRQKMGIKKEDRIIIFTGRFSHQKDPCLALDAFECLARELDNVRLYLIGDGPLLDACKELSDKKRLQEMVKFFGKQPRERVAELLSLSDVYLYTSFGNGVPVSVVEALMCGLPVITTDIPGIHDAVIDGITGFKVKGRSPCELAGYLKIALKDNEKMRDNCIRHSARFTPERAAEIISEEIEKLWT